MNLEDLVAELSAIAEVRRDEPLSRHTTFGIGGPADVYVKAKTLDELRRAAAVARRHGAPVFVLGSGSNILVGDRGIRGVVIENNAKGVGQPQEQPDGTVLLEAESGCNFPSLARRLCREGFTGLEWAVGIPGTLGGAVVYNAGAYGGCLADVLVKITVADENDRVRDIPAEELGLVYRGSVFTRGVLRDKVILSVQFRLRRDDPAAIMERVARLDEKRLAAQPRGRNAGSIFKNTPEHPAWWLIDQVGLRGMRVGDAEISQKHTNFFMNVGKARAADVKALMDLAQQRVRERFGIDLHPEVALVGEGF